MSSGHLQEILKNVNQAVVLNYFTDRPLADWMETETSKNNGRGDSGSVDTKNIVHLEPLIGFPTGSTTKLAEGG